MRKRMLIYLCILTASLAACGKRSIPVFADADTLARSLYANAGFDTDAVYAENVESTDSFRFGITITEFENAVEDAVCYRKVIDNNGQMLYALKMRSDTDAEKLAKTFFASYEFVPCDAAEKMTVASAGNYVIFFKSDIGEVDAAVEAFRDLMEGHLGFEKELTNRG